MLTRNCRRSPSRLSIVDRVLQRSQVFGRVDVGRVAGVRRSRPRPPACRAHQHPGALVAGELRAPRPQRRGRSAPGWRDARRRSRPRARAPCVVRRAASRRYASAPTSGWSARPDARPRRPAASASSALERGAQARGDARRPSRRRARRRRLRRDATAVDAVAARGRRRARTGREPARDRGVERPRARAGDRASCEQRLRTS